MLGRLLTAGWKNYCRYVIPTKMALHVDAGLGNGWSVMYPWVGLFEGCGSG